MIFDYPLTTLITLKLFYEKNTVKIICSWNCYLTFLLNDTHHGPTFRNRDRSSIGQRLWHKYHYPIQKFNMWGIWLINGSKKIVSAFKSPMLLLYAKISKSIPIFSRKGIGNFFFFYEHIFLQSYVISFHWKMHLRHGHSTFVLQKAFELKTFKE